MAIIDFILHIDQYLESFLLDYGNWVYLILFLIIFVETGIVIMPFLPGDSLLFAAGIFAAKYPEALNLWYVLILLLLAAFLGDTANYFIGKYFGEKALRVKLLGKNFVQQKHIDKTHSFYEKYGSTTIIIARFVPFVRTLAPFVAGVGKMRYAIFLNFNIIGAILWVVGITLAGYFLGGNEWVSNNFEKVVMGIILASVLPIIFSFLKAKFSKNKAGNDVELPGTISKDTKQ